MADPSDDPDANSLDLDGGEFGIDLDRLTSDRESKRPELEGVKPTGAHPGYRGVGAAAFSRPSSDGTDEAALVRLQISGPAMETYSPADAWHDLVSAGLIAADEDAAESLRSIEEAHGSSHGSWTLIIQCEAGRKPFVVVEFPLPKGIHTALPPMEVLASEAVIAAVSAGVGGLTVAAGKTAWAKLLEIFRSRGDDGADWRELDAYL